MSTKGSLEFSKTELTVLRACRIFLMITAVLALLAGLLALALKAVLPGAWSAVWVPLGIAGLVYAAVVLVLLVAFRPLLGSGRRAAAKEQEAGKPDGDDGGEAPAGAGPDFGTVVAFVSKLFGALLALGVLGIALYVSGAATSRTVAPFWFDFGRLAGMGLLVALGFFAAGTLFGFLFGLPKSHQPAAKISPIPAPAPGPAPASGGAGAAGAGSAAAAPGSGSDGTSAANAANAEGIPDDNTNLEEVSDWLTKIIVGVGLVELKQIPVGIRELSAFFVQQCGNELCGGLFVMMGIFFFIIGFISAYVMARVYLKLAIALTNRFLETPAQKTADKAKKIADQSGAVAMVNEARSTINNYRDSVPGLETALKNINASLEVLPNYPVALVEKGRALRRLSELEKKPELLREALEAVNRARELTADNYAPAVYNAACYKALLGYSLADIRDDLKKAFALNKGLKETAPHDPDLARFHNEKAFHDLLAS